MRRFSTLRAEPSSFAVRSLSLAMSTALVYYAEHYVIDVLLGWLYVGLVLLVAVAWADRSTASGDPAREVTGADGVVGPDQHPVPVDVGGGAVVLPLLATQILWINLVTDGPPALALGIDPADEGLMHQPPRPAGEGVVTGRMWRGIFFVGTVMAVNSRYGEDAEDSAEREACHPGVAHDPGGDGQGAVKMVVGSGCRGDGQGRRLRDGGLG
jgi:hypothetical protein